jgi:hypothetical protein
MAAAATAALKSNQVFMEIFVIAGEPICYAFVLFLWF